jgi:PAS domain S-box-containing protein
MLSARNPVSIRKQQLLTLMIALSLFISLGGYLYYKQERKQTREQKSILIATVGETKSKQISEWYKEEKHDAWIISQNPFLKTRINNFLSSNGSSLDTIELQAHLHQIKLEHDYERVMLTSVGGEFLFSSDGSIHVMTEEQLSGINDAVENGKASSSDLYVSKEDNIRLLDFIAPYYSDDATIKAVLIFSMNPESHLFPILESWPWKSESSETILVKIYKDTIVILSDANYIASSDFPLKIARSDIKYASAKKEANMAMIYDGTDYRGHHVMAYVNRVPGTPWTLVSKTDAKEVLEGLSYKAAAIIIIALLLVAFTGVGLSFIFKRYRSNIYRELYYQEKELSQYHIRFKAIMNSLADGVITLDVTGKIKHMNKRAQDLTGWKLYEAEDLNISNVYTVINEESGLLENFNPERIISHGAPLELTGQNLLISKHQEKIPISDTAAPITDNEGNTIGIVITFKDETEKRTQHKRIVKSEKFLSSVLNSVGDGIISVSMPDRIIIYANPAAEAIFGWEAKELFNKNTKILYPDESVYNIFGVKLAEGISSNTPLWEPELQLVKKDETEVYCDVHSTYVKHEDGSILVINTYRDVTEKRRMIKDLIEAKNKAEESDRLKSAFLANMSHEIRTPLNGIMGFSELLLNPDLARDKRNSYIKILLQSGERMMHTINDIIEVSRIEAGLMEVTISEVNLADLMKYYDEFFKPEASKKGLSLFCKEHPTEDITIISTDYSKLNSILGNLLKNALKFSAKGSIGFGCRSRGNDILFFVTDEGIGISEEKQKNIFSRFVQVDYSLSASNEGLGLGLALAKSYVEILGGKIWLESQKGIGSTFYFTLPLMKDCLAVDPNL